MLCKPFGIDVRQGINVGPGKNSKLINVGPTFIPDYRVLTFFILG